MNIVINTKVLKNALQDIVGVLGKDLSMPILSHILLEKSNKNINMTGTNLEVQISRKIEFIHAEDFDPITVPGRKLYEIVRSLDNKQIEITTNKNRLILKTETSSFKLATLPSNNFPTFDNTKTLESFTIKQTQLIDLLNKTSFSMASNPDVRFILCGLLLEITPNNLTAVATDAHRLAISTTSFAKKQINQISCIVPRKAVLELIRILQTDKETKVSIASNQIQVEFNNTRFISKLMDGKFPAGYRGVIPTSSSIEMLLDKQTIRSALQRVSILANEKFKGVRLEVSNKTVVLTSENPEQEEAKESIEHQTKTEEQHRIVAGFNAGYLIEAINACSGDMVIIGLNGPKEPNAENPEKKQKTEGTLIFSPNDNNTKYVVMPYNI